MAPYERELCGLLLGAKFDSACLIKDEFDVVSLKKYIDSMSGKDRRLAVLELAKHRATKGIGSSSSTTEPIEAPPLSVAPAEGPEQGKKRKRLVKASSLVSVAAAASVEEESSGSPLIHRQRKRPVVEGASSLQPEEIEVVEVEEGSPPPPPSIRPAPEPACPPSPCQQLPPISPPPTSPPAGQSPGPSAHPAGGASAQNEGAPPPLPISTANAEHGGSGSRPSNSGANHENFSRVISMKALEKRVKELEHDKESLQSDLEAGQGAVELMRGMVEKARKEYLVQVQETIKMEILMGQTVGLLDCKVVELQAENSSLRERNTQMVEELQAENASLRQQDSQRVEMLKSAKEATAAAERKLEEAVEGSDREEGMPFYLGAFLAVALEWRAQARNAALQTQTLQALETRVAALEEERKILGRQNETYQTTLKQAQESKAEAEKQLAEAVELQADFYAREVALKV
ncbi:uncharacterized protein [Phaseolus vulgaris]|uniref:uncharacterized protein n=1 Tax=Phaseolus vulgaris TaxID=3885 RepID=UPI0035CBD905